MKPSRLINKIPLYVTSYDHPISLERDLISFQLLRNHPAIANDMIISLYMNNSPYGEAKTSREKYAKHAVAFFESIEYIFSNNSTNYAIICENDLLPTDTIIYHNDIFMQIPMDADCVWYGYIYASNKSLDNVTKNIVTLGIHSPIGYQSLLMTRKGFEKYKLIYKRFFKHHDLIPSLDNVTAYIENTVDFIFYCTVPKLFIARSGESSILTGNVYKGVPYYTLSNRGYHKMRFIGNDFANGPYKYVINYDNKTYK